MTIQNVNWLKALVVLSVMLMIAGCECECISECCPDEEAGLNYVYSVKFTCVNEVGPAESDENEIPFEPALYRTVINVHNYRYDTTKFTIKAVIARSFDAPQGKISPKVTQALFEDEALSIDGYDIQDLFMGQQPIGDGFVVIESEKELDVVAVHTALPKDGVNGVSIDVEYIEPKRMKPSKPPTRRPDYVPVTKGPENCNKKIIDGVTHLVFRVMNQGGDAYSNSTTTVTFDTPAGDVEIQLTTGQLGSGDTQPFNVPMPDNCYDPNCDFKISVDDNNDIIESNETNNIASGVCKG